MSLSEIITVNIQAGTVSPSRRGFGTQLLMFFHDAWATDEVRTYTSFAGVAADFDTTANQRHVREAAAAVFSQNPRPPSLKIGRLPTPGSGQVTLIDLDGVPTDTTIVGTVISPDGTSTAISVAWNTDADGTATDLASDIDAITGIGASAGGSDIVTCTGDNAGESFFFDFKATPGISVRDNTADWAYDDALDNALVLDADFFFVHVENNSAKNMDKVARWALANDRFTLFAPQFTDLADFTSADFTSGSDLTALLANDSAVLLFTEDPRSTYKDIGWTAALAPLDPGSATWAYKSIEGVGADTWTASERTTIAGSAHKGNHYTTIAGLDLTRPGKCAGGEWIDVVIGLAWLEARLQERLLALLANNPKIPYTDSGISMVVAEVEGQLIEAEARGILAPGWTVTADPVANQSAADKADRILRAVEFQGTLAGAIHTANIAGTVTV